MSYANKKADLCAYRDQLLSVGSLLLDEYTSGLTADGAGEIFWQLITLMHIAADRAFPAGFVLFFHVGRRILRRGAVFHCAIVRVGHGFVIGTCHFAFFYSNDEDGV